MKRNSLLRLLIVVLVASVLCSALVACDTTPEQHVCKHVCETCGKCTDATCADPVCADKCPGHEAPHTHVFDQQVVGEKYLATAATCTAKATYYYSCVCGEKGSETFESGETLAHDFNTFVEFSTEPTLKNDGVATLKCANCDATKADVVVANLSDTSVWTIKSVTAPTETAEGKTIYSSDLFGTVTVTVPKLHVCKNVCPECSKCLDETCTEEACSDKCPGHDFAGMLKLDMASSTAKIINAQTKLLVDGDTTHFQLKSDDKYYDIFAEFNGVLKARYNAVNTPESTGAIEPWGQLASSFNKSKLKNAYSIVVESEDSEWHHDSTGSRFMSWIWYKETADSEYRNLNLELLQEGLAWASNIGQTGRYSDICWRAYNYAKAKKLYVHGTEQDPDFYYGEAIPVTLKALRGDLDNYQNKTISMECTIAYIDGANIFVEDYDTETGLYLGFPVYAGFNFGGQSIIKVGNRIRLIGKVSKSETFGWQISDLKYNRFNLKESCKLIQEGYGQPFHEFSGKQFNGTVEMTIVTGQDEAGNDIEEVRAFKCAELIEGATISMTDLVVKSVYTTETNGLMTLTCTAADGSTVKVRTQKTLYDDEGNPITEDYFKGTTISVKGVVDKFNNTYQIAVYLKAFITVQN